MKVLYVLNNSHQHQPVSELGSGWIGTAEAEALRQRAALGLGHYAECLKAIDEPVAVHHLQNATLYIYTPIVGEQYGYELGLPEGRDIVFGMAYGDMHEVGYLHEGQLIVEVARYR